jgi:uncharacterized protein YjbI with pentapeptide repeats
MRSSVTLVRNLSLLFKNLKQRSAQFWSSDRSQHVWDWVATSLKEAHSQIRAARLARPGVFWAVAFGSLPFLIVFALFISGNTAQAWPPLATFATALGATIVAIATLMRHFAQTDADRQRRIVETFSKAVEQLGSDKLELRVGAIFALERLSKESPDDYWTVMEVLTAFVRERMRYTTIMARLSERAYFLWLQAGRPEGRSEEFWAEAVRLERLEGTPTDIAAILTVIKRRSAENRQREEDNEWRFDLSGAYLSGAYLEKIYLARADLSEAHLEGAWLRHANFEKAYLAGAHFGGADLRYAHFEMAALDDAHFEDASLHEAHLKGVTAHLFEPHFQRAKLVGAHLKGAELVGAHFEGANLVGAHLEGAILGKAHFEGAEQLVEAHLEGADLSTAEGLTHDQLVSAYGDGKTRVAEGIRPKSWPLLMVEVNTPLSLSTC